MERISKILYYKDFLRNTLQVHRKELRTQRRMVVARVPLSTRGQL